MTRQTNQDQAFTSREAIVAVTLTVIVLALLRLSWPAETNARGDIELQNCVNNARQLYLATSMMAADGMEKHDDRLALPGDLRNSESPLAKVTTVSGYINRLVRFGYLKAPDVQKWCAAEGIEPWDTSKPFDGDKNCAFKIYTVAKGDGAANILLATRNFTYNAPLDDKVDPFRGRRFIVMRLGGDGAALKPKQSQTPQVLGLLPGRTDYTQNLQEMPEDTLLQR